MGDGHPVPEDFKKKHECGTCKHEFTRYDMPPCEQCLSTDDKAGWESRRWQWP